MHDFAHSAYSGRQMIEEEARTVQQGRNFKGFLSFMKTAVGFTWRPSKGVTYSYKCAKMPESRHKFSTLFAMTRANP